MNVRRLLPAPATVSLEEATTGLGLGARATAERPWVVANMAMTADGKATLNGTSGGIGGEADMRRFGLLRTQVDAIMVGPGTLLAERYGRLVRDPERRALREREGLAPDPLAVVVSRSLRLPFDIPLFEDEHSTVVVFTSSEAEPPPCAARVEVVRRDTTTLSLQFVLRFLRRDRGVRALLCEGGPHLLASLIAEHGLDELFMTIGARLAGGDGGAPSPLEGTPLPEPESLALHEALEHDGALLLRYAIEHAER